MAKKAPSQILETHGVTTLVHEMKDLPIPNEMLSEILSYVENKEKLDVSLVNKRWLEIINAQIEVLELIRRPEDLEELEQLQNLLYRFPNLRSLSLAKRINNLSELVPLKSLAFKKISLEFDVHEDLIETKNPGRTSIKRVELKNLADFENFDLNTISHFKANVHPFDNFEAIREEILSLNLVKRVSIITDYCRLMPSILKYGLIEAVLTRPNLNKIDFYLRGIFAFDSNIQQGFQKNVTVEEISLRNYHNGGRGIPNLEFWKQLSDAVPNTKRVKIVFHSDMENMLEFLKIISGFKNLKSLHFAMPGIKDSGVQKIQDCCNIVDEFPIKAKVIIADISRNGFYRPHYLEHIVEKDEGKPHKRVKKSLSRYPLWGSSFLPKQM